MFVNARVPARGSGRLPRMTALHGALMPHGQRVVQRAGWRPAKRVICSLARNHHRQLLAVAAPTYAAYAHRWGWDVVLSTEDLGEGRPPSWMKVRLAIELLQRYETVWWIDCDAIIVDLERDVTGELQPARELHLARHAQPNDPDNPVPNFGVFLVQRSAWSLEFLQRLWAQEAYVEHNWWENAALLHLLGWSLEPPFRRVRESVDLDHVGVLSVDWNSVPVAGYHEASSAAVWHHARADHDDFWRRLGEMSFHLEQTVDRHPDLFGAERSGGHLGSTARRP